MKILYSCPLDPVRLSAPGQHVASVVAELKKANPNILLIHQGKVLAGVEAEDQIALNLDRNRILKRIDSDARYAFSLFRALRKYNATCVYHRMEKWSIMPLFVFKWFKLFTVIEFNADNRTELVSTNANIIVRMLYPLSEYIQVKLSDKIVVVSEGIGKSIQNNFKRIEHKIEVVENGADVNNFYPRDRKQCCTELGLDDHLKYIVFTGSFQKWQGLETLVESALYLLEDNQNIRFILVGDGKARSEIEQMIERYDLGTFFIMPGWQSPDRVAQYISVSDVCVAPYSPLAALKGKPSDHSFSMSLMKCSPLKIFTYMAMGRPIVAAGFLDGGVRLQERGGGLAFEPGNAQALAESITKIMQDQQLAEQLGAKAYELAHKHHTWSAVGSKLYRILTRKS